MSTEMLSLPPSRSLSPISLLIITNDFEFADLKNESQAHRQTGIKTDDSKYSWRGIKRKEKCGKVAGCTLRKKYIEYGLKCVIGGFIFVNSHESFGRLNINLDCINHHTVNNHYEILYN
jgi:hypothetical protein